MTTEGKPELNGKCEKENQRLGVETDINFGYTRQKKVSEEATHN